MERDSESGLEKMAIGHHINERGHVIERSRNRRTGDQDESQEFPWLLFTKTHHFKCDFKGFTYGRAF